MKSVRNCSDEVSKYCTKLIWDLGFGILVTFGTTCCTILHHLLIFYPLRSNCIQYLDRNRNHNENVIHHLSSTYLISASPISRRQLPASLTLTPRWKHLSCLALYHASYEEFMLFAGRSSWGYKCFCASSSSVS